ncbi:DNA (cytosine-5)-methyltransferase CMT2 isoform X1 [Tanacetum coccineum]
MLMIPFSQDHGTMLHPQKLIVTKEEYKAENIVAGSQDDDTVTPSNANNIVSEDDSKSWDNVRPSKAKKIFTNDEYEVEKLVDICYNDLDGSNKRELKFKVRWAGYSPSDDTWEPIQGLR